MKLLNLNKNYCSKMSRVKLLLIVFTSTQSFAMMGENGRTVTPSNSFAEPSRGSTPASNPPMTPTEVLKARLASRKRTSDGDPGDSVSNVGGKSTISTMSNLEVKIEEYMKRLDDHAKEITHKNKSISDLQVAMATTESKLHFAEQALREKSELTAKQDAELTGFKTTDRENLVKLTKLEMLIDSKDSTIESLKKELAAKQQDIATLQSQPKAESVREASSSNSSSNGQDLSVFLNRISELEKQLASQNTQLTNLTKQIVDPSFKKQCLEGLDALERLSKDSQAKTTWRGDLLLERNDKGTAMKSFVDFFVLQKSSQLNQEQRKEMSNLINKTSFGAEFILNAIETAQSTSRKTDHNAMLAVTQVALLKFILNSEVAKEFEEYSRKNR